MNIITKLSGMALLGLSFMTNAAVIDTTGSWNGTSSIDPFGEPHTSTYGQTFLVGSENRLNSWTFYLDDRVNPDVVDFSFYVMDWNAGTRRASGSVLYQSAAVSSTNNGGLGGMEAFTFDTGGLDLTAGNDYVAFISTSDLADGSRGTSSVGSLRDESVYADGSFFFLNNGNNASAWNTQMWQAGKDFGDLAFTAHFSPENVNVPEPSSLALLALGLAGLGFARKKQNA